MKSIPLLPVCNLCLAIKLSIIPVSVNSFLPIDLAISFAKGLDLIETGRREGEKEAGRNKPAFLYLVVQWEVLVNQQLLQGVQFRNFIFKIKVNFLFLNNLQ